MATQEAVGLILTVLEVSMFRLFSFLFPLTASGRKRSAGCAAPRSLRPRARLLVESLEERCLMAGGISYLKGGPMALRPILTDGLPLSWNTKTLHSGSGKNDGKRPD